MKKRCNKNWKHKGYPYFVLHFFHKSLTLIDLLKSFPVEDTSFENVDIDTFQTLPECESRRVL